MFVNSIDSLGSRGSVTQRILDRVARFSQHNPPNCYSKLSQSHFEGGPPVKFAFRGVKLGMQRYHFFRSDPIQKILSIGQFRSDQILALFFFFINVEFLYFCVTLLCVKHNLLDNFILMKNNMKIYIGAVYLVTSCVL